MRQSTRATAPKCVCASEHVKLIGAIDGTFPDFGHHLEREMGGLWMHPIKVLDGFWLRFQDHGADNVDTWILADRYTCLPEGNEFEYGAGLGHTLVNIRRAQVAPESVPGVVVSYAFHNQATEPRRITVEFAARVDLRPVWLSGQKGICNGSRDDGWWDATRQRFFAKDASNPWFAGICSMPPPDAAAVSGDAGPCRAPDAGTGISLLYHLTIPAKGEALLTYYLTGSGESQAECGRRLDKLQAGSGFWSEKRERTRLLLARTRLEAPDERFQQAFDWIKVNTDWLIVNAGQYGRGLTAGLPEYPWWFGCDNCYALQGVLAMGDFTLCRDTLLLLARYAGEANGNGRIPHEITTFGVCANPGNTQETAHFIVMVWYYYQWTGDLELVRELMPLMRQSIAWLNEQDDDGDLFPSGYGIVEIPGLNAEMIDTAVYTCQAQGCYTDFCMLLGLMDEAKETRSLHEATRQAINTLLWDDGEGLYCDAFTSPGFVLSRYDELLSRLSPEQAANARIVLDALIARKLENGGRAGTGNAPAGAMTAGEGGNDLTGIHDGRESGWLINRNWTIATPMEAGLAPARKAERALAALYTRAFTGPWGSYLNALNPASTMTVSTGLMAVAQARYGYADRALALLEKMVSTFGMASPGTIAEMSPDYGCFVQAWTAYAMFVPVVRYLFGIQPMAGEHKLRLAPAMPSAWREASLLNVPVLDGEVSLRYACTERAYHLNVAFSGKAAMELYIASGQTVRVGDAVYPIGDEPLAVLVNTGEFTAEVVL